MTIDELCDLANAKLRDDDVVPSDSRATSEVTPRNIRYYRTLGLMSAPTRVAGRSDYNSAHLDEVLRIKRAQANGTSLSQLRQGHQLDEVQRLIERNLPGRRDDDFAPATNALVNMVQSPGLEWLSSDDSESDRDLDSDVGIASIARVQISRDADSPRFGWSVTVDGVTLSGQGQQPTAKQLRRIRRILRER